MSRVTPPPQAPPPFDSRPYDPAAVIELLAPLVAAARLGRMQTVLAHRLERVVLGVEDLHHLHNAAACLRTAEGMGLQDVAAVELRNVYPTEDPRQDATSAQKITKSTPRWLSLHRMPCGDALRSFADARGLAVWGAAPLGERSIDTLPDDKPVMVLFGNESAGLRPETLAACDGTFRIPMFGFVESYNISVSVGMTLQALLPRVRARLAAEGRTGDLTEARRLSLLARWLYEDVRGAETLLKTRLPPT
jgi:tRNA (guanosine-2'-O-)-methyltransferase